MQFTISPDLFIERVDKLFGTRKKLDSKNLRIVTDQNRGAVTFQCGARSLGIEAKIEGEGDLVVDAEAVCNIFGVLRQNAEVEFFSRDNRVVLGVIEMITNPGRVLSGLCFRF